MRKPLLDTPTLSANGKTIGKPRKVCPAYPARVIRQAPPADVCALIEQLAAALDPIILIAATLGTTLEVLRRWMDADSALKDAYDTGRARAERELVSIVLRDARDAEKPNINAFFLLKTRFGYREGEQGDQSTRVAITINLPGALSVEQFKTLKP